jgi:ATP-dependent Clp protease ATP-binding subunit ClpA
VEFGGRQSGAYRFSGVETNEHSKRMKPVLSMLNRYMPLFAAIMAVLALVQLFVYLGHTLAQFGVVPWVTSHASQLEWTVGSIAAVFALLLFLAALRASGTLPSAVTKWRWLMDILDRLTNRSELERHLQARVEAVVIDADALAQTLKSKVVGQTAICDDLAAQIRRRLALQQRNKPIGVFLFAGPPGSGKTYLGKVLAEALKLKLVHFDMTQYSSGGFAATSLFGAAKGYVGSNTYGKLTGALKETPNSVILLDEFEKAHGDVHKNFLTAWNDGFITEASDGKHVSTSQSIFVLTTNAAVDALAALSQQYADNPDELRRAADGVLRLAGFAPEVLSRIDRIFVFDPLHDLDVARVAALEIERMIQGYGLEVEQGGIDPKILFDLMDRQKKFGTAASSRDLVRAIEESIADSLIDAKAQDPQVQLVALVEKDGRVQTVVSKKKSEHGVDGKQD